VPDTVDFSGAAAGVHDTVLMYGPPTCAVGFAECTAAATWLKRLV